MWSPLDKTACPRGLCQWSAQIIRCSNSNRNTCVCCMVPLMSTGFDGIFVPAGYHCLSVILQIVRSQLLWSELLYNDTLVPWSESAPAISASPRLAPHATQKLRALDLRLFHPLLPRTWMDILSFHEVHGMQQSGKNTLAEIRIEDLLHVINKGKIITFYCCLRYIWPCSIKEHRMANEEKKTTRFQTTN